jgi:hypothetical protein
MATNDNLEEIIIPTKENAEIYKGILVKFNNKNYRSVPHLTKNKNETKYIWSKEGSLPEIRYLYEKTKESNKVAKKLYKELTEKMNLSK